ncbi:MAG: DUF883 family protein [Betaproteobacteria bacterium]|jgi:ElaB/YqjD/DUF883 family membrane-anchored ribosome-binding protein
MTTRDRLVDDFTAMLAEAEDLLRRAGSETGEKALDLRAQLEDKLLAARQRIKEVEAQTLDRAKAAARATDDYVHDHPWTAIAVAAGVGFVAGLLMNRR